MSGVRCQVSGVRGQVLVLVAGGSVINGAYPVFFITRRAISNRLAVAVPQSPEEEKVSDPLNQWRLSL